MKQYETLLDHFLSAGADVLIFSFIFVYFYMLKDIRVYMLVCVCVSTHIKQAARKQQGKRIFTVKPFLIK